MKAARLYEFGKPLRVEEIPDPELRPGGAIIRMVSSYVINYTDRLISGALGYALPTPFPITVGVNAVGLIEAVADDVFGFKKGQMVYCDPRVSSRITWPESDAILIGWTGLGPASGRMQDLWKEGTFAEKVLWPAECLTPMDEIDSLPSERLAILSYLSVVYGGLLRGGFRPSQTLIINGATGGLGSSAVIVALAMGATKIVAVARDEAVLEELRQVNPKRIVPVSLAGGYDEYTQRIRDAADGGADMLFDLLGVISDPQPTMASFYALQPGGTAVFMGGVQADIPLPYHYIMLNELSVKGAFMYPRDAPADLVKMIAKGTIDLNVYQPSVYSLDKINEAIEAGATMKGLRYAVVKL